MKTISLNVHEPSTDFRQWAFPGGEVGVVYTPTSPGKVDCVQARINTPNQLMELILATDALRNYYGYVPEELRIGYMPYARQDRYDVTGSSFACRVAAQMLDDLGYRKITILDPHSPVTAACFRKTCVEMQHSLDFISSFVQYVLPPQFGIVVPDDGAMDRAHAAAKFLGVGKENIIQCVKIRDSATGKLSGFQVASSVIRPQWKTLPLLVVDDICDGGGSFRGVATALRNAGIRSQDADASTDELYLFVSHGIFSGNALANLSKDYNQIGCTDSWQPFSVDRRKNLHVYSFFQ